MQVDPIKPTFEAPGTQRLKLKYVKLLSSFAFKFNGHRYNLELVAGMFDPAIQQMIVDFEAGAYTRSLLSST